MSARLNRRALLAGGLGLTGAVIGASSNPTDSIRSSLMRSQFLSLPRDPLLVAMLDQHAARIEPLVPEIEAILNRRLVIESLRAEDLYANYTIDLLQQTGRYDVVSMNDAWIPYFGRRGYLKEVPDPDETETPVLYPPRIRDSARGVDGTELVAYPWTFDYTCSAVSRGLGLREWSTTWPGLFRSLASRPDMTCGIGLQSPDSAAETFRAILLSYGGDLIDTETHQPSLDSFAARRALETGLRIARLGNPEAALERPIGRIPRTAEDGDLNVAPVIWASDSKGLWSSDSWDIQLVPAGRADYAATSATFWMWGVPAGAPNVDKAREFVRWITSNDVQARLWQSTGLLPATRSAMNGEWSPGGSAIKRLTLDALDRCRFRPQLRSFRSLMEITGRMVADAVTSDGAPQQRRLAANEEMREVLVQEGELEG